MALRVFTFDMSNPPPYIPDFLDGTATMVKYHWFVQHVLDKGGVVAAVVPQYDERGTLVGPLVTATLPEGAEW